MTTHPANKETIRNRMIKNAASLWGYSDTDIDTFDPVVKLLIEACSIEVYKIYNEISNSQVRGLNRLATLLTPDVLTGSKPAHAVMHSKPNDPVYISQTRLQVFYQKKIASKPGGPIDSNIDVFFSPVGEFKLTDASVKFIAAGSHIYQVNEQGSKEFFLKTLQGKHLNSYTVWLGIELNDQINNLDGVSFYFDWKNQSEKEFFFKILPLTKWYINETPINTQPGIRDFRSNDFYESKKELFDEFDLNKVVENDALSVYGNRFIHIHAENDEPQLLKKQKYPEAFSGKIAEEELYQFEEDLLWVKITFPSIFNETVLEDVSVSLNCFPVANRHLNEVRYQLKNFINIVPLFSDEQFFSIKGVTGTDEKQVYTTNMLNSDNDTQLGTYSLREAGIERFDSRNAREHLDYLIELMRDESAAFAALGQDFNASMIKDLNQKIALLDLKTNQNLNSAKNTPAYLLVKPLQNNDTLFVEYWTTNGDNGNNIRPGTKLDLYEGADLQRNSIFLMTTTSGGRDKLNSTETLLAYKSAIMTRGRIVTMEDIKTFSLSELGNKASSLEVKKGVSVGILPSEGLMRTIDVHITPADQREFNEEEWNSLKEELLSKLKAKSISSINYRVFIEN